MNAVTFAADRRCQKPIGICRIKKRRRPFDGSVHTLWYVIYEPLAFPHKPPTDSRSFWSVKRQSTQVKNKNKNEKYNEPGTHVKMLNRRQ